MKTIILKTLNKVTKKHFIILAVTILAGYIITDNIQDYLKIQAIKTELLEQKTINTELKKVEEKLNENKELIYFNGEAKSAKIKIDYLKNEIATLTAELEKTQDYYNCTKNQVARIGENKQVTLNYCNEVKENKKTIEIIPKAEANHNQNIKNNSADKDQEAIKIAMQFIKDFEGMHLNAYWDYKQYSICYGTKSTKGATATKTECEKLLKDRVVKELEKVNKLASHLTPNKKAALISFFYNVGYKDNVLRYAARGDHKSVVYLISLYNKAGGKFLQGLQNRRYAEINLYNN